MKNEGVFYFGPSAIWRDGDGDCYWHKEKERVVVMFTSYHRDYLNSKRLECWGGIRAGVEDLEGTFRWCLKPGRRE